MEKRRLGIRVVMRSLLVVMLISVVVTACGSRKELEKDVEKREMSLAWVLRHKKPGMEKVVYEDKWFTYDVTLEYVRSGFTNTMITSCPVAQARFMVTDRESGKVVRNETVTQETCNSCHPRL
ncbi:MAG: hypothetical protein ACE5GF_00235 [Thermodesulfobacteriota bacterium]